MKNIKIFIIKSNSGERIALFGLAKNGSLSNKKDGCRKKRLGGYGPSWAAAPVD